MAETTQKDKDKIIKEVYFDSGALGSIKRTLEDARKKIQVLRKRMLKVGRIETYERKLMSVDLTVG